MDILLKLKEKDGDRWIWMDILQNQERWMDMDEYSTKIRRDGLIQMDNLRKQERCMDIDGYSTKIKRDGWIQMDILQKLGLMDG